MKKRVIVAILLLFTIFVSVFAFVGCKEQTLQLLDVWQTDDGRLVLDIKDIEELSQEGDIEVSFDGGKTWVESEIESEYQVIKKDSIKTFCIAKIANEDYGSDCDIAVRLVKNKGKKVLKKSNVISFYVKDFCDFDTEKRFADVILGFKREYVDEYVFVFEDNKIVLKKYYVSEDGTSIILPLKEQDKLDFEYKLYKKEDITEEAVILVKDFMKEGDLDTIEIEQLSYFVYVLNDIYALEYAKESEFEDYDYQNDISKDDYGEGLEVEIDGEVHNYIWFAVRLKANDTTTHSHQVLFEILLN